MHHKLAALVLSFLIVIAAWPALAERSLYDEQDVSVSPKALDQFNKGERLAQNQQFDAAIAAYRQAIKLQPDYARAHHQLGLAYAALNQYPEAFQAFQEAAHLHPQWGLVHENLGVAAIKLGRWREAREIGRAHV